MISLLLVVKNGMPYLPRALQSVAAQTYRDFDLVVQDGASTDGTLEVLQQVEDIPHVRIESAPDSGHGEAYNRALAHSTGEIVGTIDADNLLTPNALETMAASFAKHPEAAAIYAGSNRIDEAGRVIDVFTPGPFDLLRLLRCELVPAFCASFFSRRACGEALRFDEDARFVQDFDLWLRLCHLPIVMDPRVIAGMRWSGTNLTCRPERYDEFCQEKIAALRKHLVSGEGLQAALWRQCSAGVYCWAAESLIELEGASDQVRRYLRLAEELDPFYERIEALRTSFAATTAAVGGTAGGAGWVAKRQRSLQDPPAGAPPPSPGTAYWSQRLAVAGSSAQLRRLRTTLDDALNLSPFQWAQWFAYVREYRPDLVIELGRSKGNSTALLTEALHRNQHGKLVSLCRSNTWNESTAEAVRPLVEADWFDRLEIRVEDICRADFERIVGNARRVLVLWDAHGFAVAEAVLARLLPLLQDREHIVVMHDISDRRYCGAALDYGDAALWQGTDWAYRTGRLDCRLCLGWIDTVVEQAIAVTDFLTRNRSELGSADHSFHQEIGSDHARRQEMARVLPPDDWSMIAHWAYFSLNGVAKPYTFPKIRPDARPAAIPALASSNCGE